MKDIVERLRARLITVPKPGSERFKPTSPITSTVGGEHKAGDDAGLQTVSNSYFYAGDNTWWVQAHIYAVEPLCEEAAAEIEHLRSVCGPEVVGAEITELKRLLRKYAATVVGNPKRGNIQCNCCGHFGLYSHKEDCELAPYLTKLTPIDAGVKQP